jgi:hypothetical protein
MKKLTFSLGYFTALTIATYTAFKYFRWPGAYIIMISSFILLALYLPIFILEKVKSAERKIGLVHIIGALCTSVLIISILFRFMHWSGSVLLIIIGILTFCLVFIPLLFYQKSRKEKANFLMNLAGSLGLFLVPISFFLKIQHWPYQEVSFVLGNVLIFLVYFPLYVFNKSELLNNKTKYLQDSFNILIIAYILFLLIYGIIAKWPITYKDLIQTGS